MSKKPIIIVSGEPYSVFFEILFKIYASNFFKKYKFPLIVIGSNNLLKKQMKKMNYKIKINLITENEIKTKKINNQCINLLNVNFETKKTFDKISNKSSKYIKKCFETGLRLMKKKVGLGIINGPISKKHFLNKKFNGITEYLSSATGTKNKEVMLIYNKKLSVVPITTHIPLKNVSKELSINKISYKVEAINNFYVKYFNKKPKFVVTVLNPHCETTSIFSEEKKIIEPAIKKLKKKKINLVGPISADTTFFKDNLKKYDVVVGMYHDQVLTPIKTIYGFDAINITVGLKFIRISPDHGTNNEMLGKNKSSELSLQKTLNFFNEINAN